MRRFGRIWIFRIAESTADASAMAMLASALRGEMTTLAATIGVMLGAVYFFSTHLR